MKAFQSQGGIIVGGLSKGEWANVKRAGAVLPAGKICPTAKPYSDDPNAEPSTSSPKRSGPRASRTSPPTPGSWRRN